MGRNTVLDLFRRVLNMWGRTILARSTERQQVGYLSKNNNGYSSSTAIFSVYLLMRTLLENLDGIWASARMLFFGFSRHKYFLYCLRFSFRVRRMAIFDNVKKEFESSLNNLVTTPYRVYNHKYHLQA